MYTGLELLINVFCVDHTEVELEKYELMFIPYDRKIAQSILQHSVILKQICSRRKDRNIDLIIYSLQRHCPCHGMSQCILGLPSYYADNFRFSGRKQNRATIKCISLTFSANATVNIKYLLTVIQAYQS